MQHDIVNGWQNYSDQEHEDLPPIIHLVLGVYDSRLLLARCMRKKTKQNSTLMPHVVEGSWVPGQIIFVCTLAYNMQYKTYLASNLTANCC